MKNIRLIKVVTLIASAAVLVAIGVIIGINVNINKQEAVFVNPGTYSWYMECSDEGVMIDSNFWSFARASYVLIGTPPECEFYKIVSEVPRNDYEVSGYYIDDESDKMYYHGEDGTRESTIAVDVSAYQPYIDWNALKAAGVEVAMLRVGYRGYGSGALVIDDMFATHAQNASDAGIQIGVYFFSQANNYDEGVEEAQFVLDVIKDYDIKCPVAADTEEVWAEDARTNGLDVTSRTDSIVGFCDTVKAAGYTPMIYSNRNWFVQRLDLTRLGGYKFWVAHYANQPDFPYVYTGWQYTNEGQINGIDGNVDMNVWFR